MCFTHPTELYDNFYCKDCLTLVAQTVRGNVNPQYQNIANDFCPNCGIYQSYNDIQPMPPDLVDAYFSHRQDTIEDQEGK